MNNRELSGIDETWSNQKTNQRFSSFILTWYIFSGLHLYSSPQIRSQWEKKAAQGNI